MKIGDPILRSLTETVNIIERQFNTVEFIDNFNLDEKDPFELLKTITKILRSISDCDVSQLFMKLNSEPEECFTYPKKAEPELKIIDSTWTRNIKKLKVINQKKEQRSLLIVKINSSYIPECYIVLKETYFGRNNSKIHDKEFQLYLVYIAEKLVEKIDHYSKLKLLINHRDLSIRFLTSHQKSDFVTEKGKVDNSIWINILRSTFEYLPLWGPLSLKFGETRMQILKVQKGRRFLNLLAESEEENGKWKIVSKDLNLDKDWTICGIYLDNEEKNSTDKYLLVNPKEYKNRYASILFSNDEIPESELIIPIKDLNNKTIVLLNFENIHIDAFSKFHIDMLIRMAKDVEPFVNYAIYKNEQQIDIEKKLRYLMLRITTKLTSTQQHKLKGDFGNLISAIREIEIENDKGNKSIVLAEINSAKQFIQKIQETSIDFTVNLQDFIQFGKKNINDVLNKALPDVKKKAQLSGDNITIQTDDIPIEKFVFCSGLAQEHIHNILQNSIDQFINIRKNENQNFVGEINVKYSEINRSDRKANIYTYNLIEISISDNGGGIPQDKEEWIFGFNNSLKKEDGGHGFGLYAAKEYMHEVGGELILENHYPKGATFKLRFPEYQNTLHDALAEQLNIKGGK